MGHHTAGRLAEAEAIYRELLAEQPGNAEVTHLLGQLAGQAGDPHAAVELISQAIATDPLRPHYRVNLSSWLTDLDRCAEAVAACEAALALRPHFAEAHYCLGNARARQGRHEEAIAAYETALRLKPDFGEGFANLGLSLIELGRLDEAIDAYLEGLRHTPQSVALANNLAMALRERGEIEDSLAWLRRGLAWQPGLAYVRSNLVLFSHLHPGYSADELAEELRAWQREHGEPLQPSIVRHDNDPSPERRLRIGYVSADLRDHVVGRTLLPCFEAHDRAQFELFCYSATTPSDPIGERFRSRSAVWGETALLSDEKLAAQIRADRIDILVDLSLHTAGNRLPVFARRPAPVQVCWLGYPGTTGLAAIDYRITDPYLEPAGFVAPACSEEALRLPDCWTCYTAPADSPEPGALPATRRGAVTFGSFNHLAKINERVLAVWAEILQEVEGSRLRLLAKGRGQMRAVEFLAQRGIAPERIELVGHYLESAVRRGECRATAFLERYREIDLALDPFPYNGMTTTCDALWMGVPVVALLGAMPHGRASFSLLSNVGLPELAAPTEREYVRVAAELARDLPRLAALRATLRARMKNSPLLDPARFARNLEAAYRGIWRRWCAQPPALQPS